MAATKYQSSQTNTSTNSNTVAVTKPASLAVGDFMIAAASLAYGATGFSISAPAGWTTLGTETDTGGAFAAFWKIADASDVAASSFTFTGSGGGTADAMAAGITRLSGQNLAAPIDQSVTDNDADVSGITPTVAMGLFVMLACVRNSSGDTGTVAGYTIATHNPTWIEGYDVGAGTNRAGVAMAYANSTRLEATGIASVTLTSYNNCKLFLLNIVPNALPPLALGAAIPSVSLRYDAMSLALSGTMGIPTYEEVASKWTNVSKHTATWVNTPKS